MKKCDLVNGAYSKLRISGITVNPSPEDVQIALSRLEDMMSEWQDARNVCLDYDFDYDLMADPNAEAGIPRFASEAVKSCLAVRLIPDFNKQVPPQLERQAAASFSAISGKVHQLRETAYPRRQPRGNGNTTGVGLYQRYYFPDDRAPANCKTEHMVAEGVRDFNIEFSSILKDETISSYTKAVESGLTLLSESTNADGQSIDVRVKADRAGSYYIDFKVTASDGQIYPRTVYFSVAERKQI